MTADWFDTLWSAMTGPFGGCLLIVGGGAALVFRRIEMARNPRAEGVGVAILLMGTLAALLVAREVALPTRAIAEGTLDEAGQELAVPPVDARLSVLLHSDPPPLDADSSTQVQYSLAVFDGDRRLFRHTTSFDEPWERRRVGRGVRMNQRIVHASSRLDLPQEARARPLTIRVEGVEGELWGPVQASVIPGPPSETLAALVGAAFLLAGAFVDALEGLRTHVGTFMGFLAAFVFFLLRGITPEDPLQAVLGPGLLALVTGLPAAWLSRRVLAGTVRSLTPRREAPTR